MNLGPHAVFIWLCYGIAAVVVAALLAWLHLEGRRLAVALADLERRGLSRSRNPDAPEASE